MHQQKSDIIQAERKVWGNAQQLCAGKDCEQPAEQFSCYCRKCEEEMED